MCRRINPFYLAVVLWLVLASLYLLQWSDYCSGLNMSLCLFLIYMIALLVLAGYVLEKKTSSSKRLSDFDTGYETRRTTIILIVVLTLGMVLKGNVPLLNMSKGLTYTAVNVGIPFVGALASAYAMFHSFRLSFLFFTSRKLTYLLECLAIFLCYFLMFQRQNMVVCALGFWFAFFNARMRASSFSVSRIAKLIVIAFVLLAIGLFVFGAIGNYRFGIWDWNDSSMIEALGLMNDRWPKWLPGEYFWFYIYMVTPLGNLNSNISMGLHGNDFVGLAMQLLPTSITSRIGFEAPEVYLPEPSLTASTAFAQPYLAAGVIGMYLYITIAVLCVYLIMRFAKGDGSTRYATSISMSYYLFLMVFDNPSMYLMTSYLMIISVLFIIKPLVLNAINRMRGKHFKPVESKSNGKVES